MLFQPMPQIEQNAPDFKYRVQYKQDSPDASWNSQDLTDWQLNQLVIQNLPAATKYRMRVVALNRMGQANLAVREVIGYSGE